MHLLGCIITFLNFTIHLPTDTVISIIGTHTLEPFSDPGDLNVFIHSFGLCRMRQFLAVLRSFFHSSLLYTFPATLLHQLFFHPLSPHLAIYFMVYLSILLFQNSYIIPFQEFYFLPFSVHAQTNVIYLTLLSLL